ncbi:hypothetical protein [Runella salmonicolor]|uniref:Uncharacterized protein n=1 Tax=Runella salmonicolor TaxID=2950278 RepID=A0ABT1FSW1_9BACT|nr:hypothetical protein [Runella salmonicolor]MCP1384852.1 hypothetical protein [Runella salmonicolor]
MNLPPYAKPITLDEQIAIVEREVRMRESVYPKWCSGPNPKMKPEEAAFQLEGMRAVLKQLRALKSKEGIQTNLFGE